MLQLIKVVAIALRMVILPWAVFVLVVGLVSIIDPSAADSEPTPYNPADLGFGIMLVVLSLLWMFYPRLRHKRLRNLSLTLLILLPTFFVFWALLKYRNIFIAAEDSARIRWPLRFAPVIAALSYLLPSLLTILYSNIARRGAAHSHIER